MPRNSLETGELKNIGLFSSLSDRDLSDIKSRIVARNYKKNEVILHEADTNRFMYIILSGGVKVVQISEEGKETILALHKAGDFFGEMSLIDGKTAPATVISTEGSTVAVISKENFQALISIHGNVLLKLLQIFCARIRESFERIQILSFNNATHRIRMMMLMLAELYGRKTEGGTLLDIKLTHQNIADMAGITRETVSRIINRLKKDGEISMKQKRVFLGPEFMKKEFTIK